MSAAASARGGSRVAQAWIELKTDDPSAVSALGVARARIPAGRGLAELRRVRLVELRGTLPAEKELKELLHRSTWFYNPHKESCRVRVEPGDAAPVSADARIVLVVERDRERNAAAERWWQHETGERVQVREGTAWIMRFAQGEDAEARAADLAVVRDREHGLLCNENAQWHRHASADVPLPWIDAPARGPGEERDE